MARLVGEFDPKRYYEKNDILTIKDRLWVVSSPGRFRTLAVLPKTPLTSWIASEVDDGTSCYSNDYGSDVEMSDALWLAAVSREAMDGDSTINTYNGVNHLWVRESGTWVSKGSINGPPGVSVLEGDKSSAVDAGQLGEISLGDDWAYFCTKSGTAGNAIWKKTPLLLAS